MKEYIKDIIYSWKNIEGNVNSNIEILQWIEKRNKTVKVNIERIKFSQSDTWGYYAKEGSIHNSNRSFFQIKGIQKCKDDNIILEQPIIIQNEIGYLGIICKEINGVLNFLMQAKIEPGNINKIQISPTIQATKSNFMQKHGGSQPPYLEYFVNACNHEIIVDQIQSEQSSRFYKKRNRNIIIKVQDEIEILPSHKWMTLGQIKYFMKMDNLVNMDTRTVLSCIPFCSVKFNKEELNEIKKCFKDKSLYNSIFNTKSNHDLVQIYHYINNYKMFKEYSLEIVPLHTLTSWEMKDEQIECKEKGDFRVICCNIQIEGREVKQWTQPLFEATGMATFGLITCIDNGIRKFLVQAQPEVGCFDKIELGPSVQKEASEEKMMNNLIDKVFYEKIDKQQGIIYNVVLSEEGGRFYHEQNHNIIIEIDRNEIKDLPKGYFWVDYCTLNTLVQVNNCLNIQLRNLLSLLEV